MYAYADDYVPVRVDAGLYDEPDIGGGGNRYASVYDDPPALDPDRAGSVYEAATLGAYEPVSTGAYAYSASGSDAVYGGYEEPEFAASVPAPLLPGVAVENAPVPAARDWHAEFLALTDRNASEELEVFVAAFSAAAERYAKEIISDLGRTFGRRHKAIDAGGVAGGLKYLVDGIFFKLAVDEFGLYGSNQVAGKVASREILSTNYLIGARSALLARHAELERVTFPLSCCITYCGVTVLASTRLPIGRDTLVYGSADAGRTVYASDGTLNAAMRALGDELRLRPHVCAGGVTLSFGADVEGHRGTDGRYYVLDTSRTFPCEPLTRSSPKGAFLYRLLRPELVMRSEVALSSDAFSRFAQADPETAAHNRDVRAAHAHLTDTLLPRFLARMRARPVPDTADDVRAFTAVLHAHGINVRCLGALYTLCVRADAAADAPLRAFLLREVVARAVKNVVRRRLGAGVGPDVSAAHATQLRRVFCAPPSVVATEWAPVLEEMRVAFGVALDAVPAACMAAQPRAMELLGCRGDLSPGAPPLVVEAKVKSLFSFSFNVARQFYERNKRIVDMGSIAAIRRDMERYGPILRTFSAHSELWNDRGIAALEIVRRLHGAQTGSAADVRHLLDVADEALETSAELCALDARKGEAAAEVTVNWALVARYRAEILGEPGAWDVMESRVRSVLGGPHAIPTLVHNGAFFLAIKGRELGDMALLREARALLRSLPAPQSPLSRYDLASVCIWLGEPIEAAELLQQVVAGGPELRVEALYMLGTLGWHAGGTQLAQARDHLQRALAEDATFYKAHALLADVLLHMRGDGAQTARQRYDTLLQVVQHADSAIGAGFARGGAVLLTRAKAYREMHQLGDNRPAVVLEALQSLRDAVRVRSGDAHAWLLCALSAWDAAQLVRPGYNCDGPCEAAIAGRRHHCATCGDYDLCDGCAKLVAHEHELQLFDGDVDNDALTRECNRCAVTGMSVVAPDAAADRPDGVDVALSDFVHVLDPAGVATQALDMMQRLAVWPEWAATLLRGVRDPARLVACLDGVARGRDTARYAALFLANCAVVAELRPALVAAYGPACAALLRDTTDAVACDALGRLMALLLQPDSPAGVRDALCAAVPQLAQVLTARAADAELVAHALDLLERK